MAAYSCNPNIPDRQIDKFRAIQGDAIHQFKKWFTDTYNNMDEFQVPHARWKKLNTKDYILWLHLYKISRKGESLEIEGKFR